MIISAKFLSSLPKFDENFSALHTEIAFLGRSNVGKSSLINALCHQKQLAKSSSTPGKTQLINFFEVIFKQHDERIIVNFIDLPGFGYARVSKSLKEIWNKNLDEFLKLRNSIKLFIHLIDSRHTDLELDESVDAYLQSFLRADQKVLKVFTKSDKLNQSQKARLKNAYKNAVLVSSYKKDGLQNLEELILKKSLGVNGE
ncbi:YihA family ribosome biogenesis GTP-binding protein [Campylobacter sp. MIT 99-7217]|uniref:ribosome biogenesis GTP-binding protein YihA/YsxC n=1 Tax=Campylobacter sp. MIT 99-7217 TaxID=535091 RepID=UPI00115BEFAE|nr:ribosome biogenesis GTP-binding protein YihA/YsxC [Campylobacter sp. MIT 99-7217]TQR31906.1 YihA family ribosome biogenesis GTP-binding protein [Campylobacter sp. MIT 99-7217]